MKKMERSSSSISEVVDGGSPKMGLRILLVEADDCTRRLVAALLRKCSYKVLAVSDGLKAWETLKSRHHNIDLILTEVELPSISGYALLTLIMEHDICKTIPVIMMSSQDSISVVLKCMLRGAADFLVKPIRRNELRNLWQHVWRRQNKTEVEIVQNTTDVKCKALASCQKNSDGIELSSSNVSSGNRKEESVKLIEKSVLPKSETGGKPSRSGPEVVPHEETYKSSALTFGENPASVRLVTSNACKCAQSDRENDITIDETNSSSHECIEPSSAVDYISKFEDYSETDRGYFSAKSGIEKHSFTPNLELSLRKSYPTGAKDEGTTEQYTINHSIVSAFSRYENNRTLQSSSSAVDCNVGPVDVMNGNHENLMTRTVGKFGQVDAAIQGSQFELIPLAGLRSSTLRHNYIPRTFNAQDVASLVDPNADGRCDQSILPMSSSFHSGLENQNDDTIDSHHNVLEDDKEGGFLDGLRDVSAPDLCANSSSCGGATEMLNGGVCSSNCSTVDDSNSQPPASVTNSLVSESVYSSQLNFQEGALGMDSCNLSQREAALQKFRLKRKGRCFDKKVRYQSRKRLAEQWPRVRGQFVRQAQALRDDC